ncbi:hypothetical protein BH09PSE3_BH09PSE3_03970 [soil metagenome]
MDQAVLNRPAPEKDVRRWHRSSLPANTDRLPDWAYSFVVANVMAYAFRDTLTGSLRFYLDKVGLSALWFIPDLMAFICIGIFGLLIVLRSRSVLGFIFLVNIFTAAIIGAIFMNQSTLAFVTGVKAVIPIFIGLCFAGRSITERRGPRIFMFVMMLVSVIGLVLNPHFEYPWVGAEISNFGFTKTVGKLWWDSNGVRYGGFAGDSTMAAFMVIFPYLMLYRHFPRWGNVALWPLLYYALDISTSKTALILLMIFIPIYIWLYIINSSMTAEGRRRTVVTLAKLSFIFVIVPFLLIGIFGGANLTQYDHSLYSLQDRIDSSWQKPFSTLADIFPAGLLLGCGLGCFSYPMTYTEVARYWVPVDNFYLTTYLMLGFPFLIIVIAQAWLVGKVRDEGKLMLITLINIYTLTVACYGPSFATLVVGYTFGDLFLSSSRPWSRQATNLQDPPPGIFRSAKA